MVGLLFKELGRKSKLVLSMAVALIIYLVIIGLLGKYNNLILAGNYITSLGSASNIVSFEMMILASLSFGGNSSRKYLNEVNQDHGFISAYLAQTLSVAIEYVFLMAINVGTVLIVQNTIFAGKAFGPNHIRVMINAVQANAYYMLVLLPLTALVTMGVKNNLNAIAIGIATNYVGQGIAYVLMLWIYSNRFLKWNPFNMLMVEGQIIKPINHTMTKLYNNEAIGGVYIYAVIFLVLILWIFGRRQKFAKIQQVEK